MTVIVRELHWLNHIREYDDPEINQIGQIWLQWKNKGKKMKEPMKESKEYAND